MPNRPLDPAPFAGGAKRELCLIAMLASNVTAVILFGALPTSELRLPFGMTALAAVLGLG